MFISKADKIIKINTEKVEQELKSKTLEQIHRETAITWLERALAAKKMNMQKEYDDLAHESLEHAALTHDIDFVKQIMDLLKNEQ